MQHFKRKKKLINSRLQLKLIGVFLGVSCVASLFQVVLLNRSMMSLAQHLPQEGDRLLGQLPGILLTNIVLTIGVLCPLTFLVGLLVTHRVAGPAYRMTQHCKAVARGQDVGPCRIRKDDELWELCDALNEALDHLRSETAQDGPSAGRSEVEDAPSLAGKDEQPARERSDAG